MFTKIDITELFKIAKEKGYFYFEGNMSGTLVDGEKLNIEFSERNGCRGDSFNLTLCGEDLTIEVAKNGKCYGDAKKINNISEIKDLI